MEQYNFTNEEYFGLEAEVERLDKLLSEKMDEIILLKKTVKALSKMILHYRIGKSEVPEWVFNNLDKAKDKYGDLNKII